jgi:thiol-disulfide isomerase/thioredoxin
MFNQYQPNVNATIAFLKLQHVKVNSNTVNETLQNHPDWPGLLCISDSLNKWNVPNGAGKIEIDKMDDLPTPFLAYTNNSEYPLVIVAAITPTSVDCYTKKYKQLTTITREDFLKSWTGIYLIAETTEHSGEKAYQENKRKAFINALVPVSFFLLLFTFSLLFIYRTINANLASIAFNTTAIYLQYFILLIGVIITSLLLWYEVDKNNPLLQKVCTGIVKGNCNAILTGRQSKLFSWLSWSEVGFFYFSGSLVCLLFAGHGLINMVTVLAWLNMLALPYTVFSVYYQWKVAKQWCVLCIAVQALLLLGCINIYANNLLAAPFELSIPFLIKFSLLNLLPVLSWYAARPFIHRLQEAKNTKREYLRIKFNTEIFETLLKKQKAITVATDGLGISLGNPGATNTIIKVCSPYCGPCSKAHPKIEELLEAIPNLKVKIIFTTSNQPEERAYKLVSHLLAINVQGNEENIKQALNDWYLTDKKDYELFAKKYPMNGELVNQGNKIEAMHKWCEKMDIDSTPTIIVNDYQLPDAYSIEDLQYFLLE